MDERERERTRKIERQTDRENIGQRTRKEPKL